MEVKKEEIVKESGIENKVSLKLLISILVLTVVLSLVASYFVVTLMPQEAYSQDSGRIVVEVVGSEDELFTTSGQIKVEVVSEDDS